VKTSYCLVKWRDSQAGPGWRDRPTAEKWANSPGQDHLSLGFRLPIGPKGDVVLAQSYQLAHRGSVGELLHIPRSAVKWIRILGRIDEP